jgi:hypothetical protein
MRHELSNQQLLEQYGSVGSGEDPTELRGLFRGLRLVESFVEATPDFDPYDATPPATTEIDSMGRE